MDQEADPNGELALAGLLESLNGEEDG